MQLFMVSVYSHHDFWVNKMRLTCPFFQVHMLEPIQVSLAYSWWFPITGCSQLLSSIYLYGAAHGSAILFLISPYMTIVHESNETWTLLFPEIPSDSGRLRILTCTIRTFLLSWFLSNMLSELKMEGISFLDIWFEIESKSASVIAHLNFFCSYILFIYFLDANILPSQWVHDCAITCKTFYALIQKKYFLCYELPNLVFALICCFLSETFILDVCDDRISAYFACWTYPFSPNWYMICRQFLSYSQVSSPESHGQFSWWREIEKSSSGS